MANKPKDSNNKTVKTTKGSPFLAALFKVLGTLIIVIVLVFSVPAAVPRILGFQLYNIVSGSMEPTIPVGAAVYVQSVDPYSLETGNIIAFEVNGDVVVHRVTSNNKEEHELHTKGDANDAEDMWGVPYANLLGRVRVSVRMLGGILDFSTSSSGKLYIFAILFAGIIFSILGKILTPPDELYIPDSKDNKKAKTKEKTSTKSISTSDKSKTVSESTGIPKTITVSDAVNNKVDESLINSEPSNAELELSKPVSLTDLAKDFSVNPSNISSEQNASEEVKTASEITSEADAETVSIVEKTEEITTSPVAESSKEENPPEEDTSDKKASKATKNSEKEKYKKMMNAIIIIIILLVVALLGILGSIFYINYRYSKMDEQANSQVEQFTSTPAEEPEEIIPEEIPEDKFILHTTQKCPIDVDFDSLKEVNPDVVGWIYCEDTVINYPILQGDDDEYYLHHDLNGNKTSAGSIFVDCNNMGDFTDVNSIIYGHHMKNGSMFACLQNWENQDFYDNHKYMWLITPDGNYEVWIYSGYLTDAYSDSYLGIRNWGEMAEEYVTTAESNSDITPLVGFETFKKCSDEDQRYIMLSTCEYEFQNARYVIHGKLVKETPGIYGNPDLNADGSIINDSSDNDTATLDSTEEIADEATAADSSENYENVNFNNLVEIKNVNSTSSNMISGKYAVLKYNSDKCDQTFLTDYYYNYVKNHDDLLWSVIYYADKSDYTGIYISNGLIEKDVRLNADGYLVDSSNEILFKEAANNTLEQCSEDYVP